MDRLQRIAGKAAADETLVAETLSIGRGEEADLRLFDETASRRHATLSRRDGRVLLEDLGSANGTTLNGTRVARAVLCDGDVIGIGSVRLRFLTASGADRPTREVPAGDGPLDAVTDAEPDDATVEAAVFPADADPAKGGGAGAVARLSLVCRAAEAAADATEPRALAEAILDLLVEALSPDRAAIHAVRGSGLAALADHPRGSAAPPASRTLARRALEGGEAVLVRDAADPAARRDHASLVASPWRTTIAAPLVTVEGTAGLVVLESRTPAAWTADDLAVVAAVARLAALALRTLSALGTARAEARRLAPSRAPAVPDLLGDSPAMKRLVEQVDRAGQSDATVLVLGETGTGKELVARRLHAKSPRAGGPFVALNCAALVEGLLESELFGHEKGAFTGAEARREGRLRDAAGGTLFLDEVGELSPALQAKLLRALSDRTFTRVGGSEVLRFDGRLVAATHRDLPALVRDGRFREDLWFRVAVVTLTCPPLRERGADLDLLADALLERVAARLSRRVPRLADGARARLRAHRWPGNVRELENALERALVLCEGETIEAQDLPLFAQAAPAGTPPGTVLTVREAEKRAVLAALERTQGKKGEAAALLGISWPTLNRKLRDYGL